MKLYEVISATDIQFAPINKLSYVLEVLVERSQGCALICDDGNLVGILGEADIMRLFSQHLRKPIAADITVGQVMTAKPVTIPADIDLSEALAMIRELNLRHLPVVDSYGLPVGIVHLADLVTAYLGVINKQNQLEELNKEMHWLSLEDSLTGLPNRRAMEIDLRHNEAVARRRKESYAVAVLDIDHFKSFNEHYSAPVADKVLKQVAKILKDKIRTSDRVFRYGGEEFLYLMPGTSSAGASIAADRLRQAVADAKIEHRKCAAGILTVSVGVSAKESGVWQELLKQAENAVYQAKMQGRNAICVADNSIAAD